LSFFVDLCNEAVLRVLAGVDVPRVCEMISISTHATFAFVLTPLDAKPPQFNSLSVYCAGRLGKNLHAEFLLAGSISIPWPSTKVTKLTVTKRRKISLALIVSKSELNKALEQMKLATLSSV